MLKNLEVTFYRDFLLLEASVAQGQSFTFVKPFFNDSKTTKKIVFLTTERKLDYYVTYVAL